MYDRYDDNWMLMSPAQNRKNDTRTYYGYIKTGEIKADNPIFYQKKPLQLAN